MDKRLEKGTLELVDQTGLGFYSRLFLVQKEMGGVASCDRLIESEWICPPYEVVNGNNCIGLGVDQERGRDVLD